MKSAYWNDMPIIRAENKGLTDEPDHFWLACPLKYQPLPVQLWASMHLTVRRLNEAVIVRMYVSTCFACFLRLQRHTTARLASRIAWQILQLPHLLISISRCLRYPAFFFHVLSSLRDDNKTEIGYCTLSFFTFCLKEKKYKTVNHEIKFKIKMRNKVH